MTRRALLGVWLVALGGCERTTPKVTQATPIAVRVGAVKRVKQARPVYATGVLANKSEVKASFKVGGLIASIGVDEGDVVHAGQVLAELDMTEIDANVRAVRQAKSKAYRDLRRAKQLLRGAAATREQVEDARTAAAMASAQTKSAVFNKDHAMIVASADGRVLRRMAEAGEAVGPGQPVLVLASEQSGWIARVSLADRDVLRIRVGDPAVLECAALPGVSIEATVAEIAAAATPPLGTFEVELRLTMPPEGLSLLSGLIVRARIEARTADTASVAMISAAALRDGDGKSAAVWVPNASGGVDRRQVEIAFFDGEMVAVASGLDGVDRVVTDGAAYLVPRSQIKVADSPGRSR